jgi:23S rRNA (cytosine1962-C5)-methyltransferase
MADDDRVADPIDEPSEHVLLDIGDGRQLARFGPLIVDRPYPAATDPAGHPGAWASADLRFERPAFGGAGEWMAAAKEPPAAWTMRHAGLTFELRPTASGQVGFFGEQVEPWRWLRRCLRAVSGRSAGSPPAHPDSFREEVRGGSTSANPMLLNLFAYTGGATLAAAAEGAAVTHVDASRSAVAWARHNAQLSGLAEAPIRWNVDDALGFVRREARRGRRYDGIVLDPPSYGHGPRGERWSLAEHASVLLDACFAVAEPTGFVLLTAHAEGLRPGAVADELAAALARAGRGPDADRIEAGALELHAASGARAPAGVFARLRP